LINLVSNLLRKSPAAAAAAAALDISPGRQIIVPYFRAVDCVCLNLADFIQSLAALLASPPADCAPQSKPH